MNKWKPKTGEKYYTIGGSGDIFSHVWCNVDADEKRSEFCNCFKTKKEAKNAISAWKTLFTNNSDNAVNGSKATKKIPDWCVAGAIGFETRDSEYFKVERVEKHFIYIKYPYNNERVNILNIDYFTSFDVVEARLRPFGSVELSSLVGSVISINSFDKFLVVAYNYRSDDITVGNGSTFSAKMLLDNGCKVDGKICGVFEHKSNNSWIE